MHRRPIIRLSIAITLTIIWLFTGCDTEDPVIHQEIQVSMAPGAVGEVISSLTKTNPEASEAVIAVLSTPEFEFRIIAPVRETEVDRVTKFRYKLRNLSETESIQPGDVDGAQVAYVPGVPAIYHDDTNFLIDFSDISIAPGKVVTGWFFYIDWSDQVPVGWVQGGYMSIEIGGIFQSVPYQVTIVEKED